MLKKQTCNKLLTTLVAILTVFALIFSLGGSYYYFKLKQLSAEKQIQENISSGKLGCKDFSYIAITAISDFKWHKNHKEFEYKGELFDIVSIIKTNSGTFYKCINDLVEKRIIKEAHKQSSSKESQRVRYSLSNCTFSLPETPVNLTKYITIINAKPCFLLRNYLFDTPSPPPKSA